MLNIGWVLNTITVFVLEKLTERYANLKEFLQEGL